MTIIGNHRAFVKGKVVPNIGITMLATRRFLEKAAASDMTLAATGSMWQNRFSKAQAKWNPLNVALQVLQGMEG